MAANYKNPPEFDEKTSYETWKNELAIWELVTGLPKNRHALAVSLSLKGRAREIAMEIDAQELHQDGGMKTLTDALDAVFKKEDRDSAYEAYSNFDTLRKKEENSMTDFIIEFERKYHRCKKYDMALPDAVLAFKLLDGANLSVKERQLALTATSELTFACMKSALKRIFGESKSSTSSKEAITVKQESAFYTQPKFENSKYRSSAGQSRNYDVSKKTNPLNRYGKPTKCAICQSIFHWAKNCPDKRDEKNTKRESVQMTQNDDNENVESCNVTLFSKECRETTPQEIFVSETVGAAVIDTACTKTVCGEQWLDTYLNNLNGQERKKVESSPSKQGFKFGDGIIVHSLKNVKIPARIGDTKCTIETEVVPSNIPLLLSKMSLKRAGAVLDLTKDKAIMFGAPVNLEFTSSGHYCVNILDVNDQTTVLQKEVLFCTDDMTEGEQKKAFQKLHKQFGHASAERLKRLLKSSGTNLSEVTVRCIETVVNNCDVCIKYGKPAPKPAVGMPLATEYNETVAVDLHELEKNVWYLHIIDVFTRFSAGCIMKTKMSAEFVKRFIQCWISIHGAPRVLFSDNGGEFNSDVVRDMCENYNIEVKTTAGYSPWSNGIVERHNQTLTEILHKVKNDNGCDWETALAWALMAKNSLHNAHGYSPYQLVFGKSPNLPSVLTDRDPALEGTTTSTTVAQHITAMYSSRKAFTEAECSERIRRALRKQTRPNDEVYIQGDKVYYKRPDGNEWKGPGSVIGQDGVIVFVRHGGSLVRVHRSRLKKVTAENHTQPELVEDKLVREDQTKERKPVEFEESDSEIEVTEEATNSQSGTTNSVKAKSGQIIKYVDDRGTLHVGEIISRAGKATGSNKNWFNVEFSQPDEKAGTRASVDLSHVDSIEDPLPLSDLDEANVMVLEDVSFNSAKAVELENWRKNDVYVEIPDEGQRCITTRWICTLKDTKEGTIHKARLVARGFEEIEKKTLPKDSPTCSTEGLRMILAVTAQQNWTPHSMDIKTAFLQGTEMIRDVYIRPPKEADVNEKIWKMKKCVYGLCDASLQWYNRVRHVMIATGGKVSSVDPAVFYWVDAKGTVCGFLASHVDDFIWAGNEKFKSDVIPEVKRAFCVGREESKAFRYVGIALEFANSVIFVDQKNYINNLQFINIDKSRACQRDSHLNDEERNILRSKIGQILWVARQSRPDVIFDACSLASSLKTATVENLLDANKVIRRLKSEDVVLKFTHLGDKKSLKLVVFSDASLGNLPDGGTQGGHFIILMGDNQDFSPIIWQSRRLKRVVRSSLAGETLALTDALDTAVFLASLHKELSTGLDTLPIICVVDSYPLCQAVQSTKAVTDKRLRIEISSIKEMIDKKQIKDILWSSSKDQLADCLTKKGASAFGLLKALSEGHYDITKFA